MERVSSRALKIFINKCKHEFSLGFLYHHEIRTIFQVKSDELTEELKKYRQYETEAKQIIASLEETLRNSERERLKVQSIKVRKVVVFCFDLVYYMP